MNDRYANLRNWLTAKHGKPQNRTFLTHEEAIGVTNCVHGRNVTMDLAIGLYPGKWTRSVEHSITRGLDTAEMPFWLTARLRYFELGGAYKDGMGPTRVERVQ